MRSNLSRGQFLIAVGSIFLSGSVLAAADLVLNVNDSPDPGLARGTFNYEWRVDNNGPDQANDVVFEHTYPVGASFVSVAPAAGCVDNGVTRTLTCQIGNLANGASATRDVKITLPTAKVWHNTGTVTSNTDDNDISNNTLTEPTTVTTAADIELTAVSSNPTPVAGESYNYQLTASNFGPSPLIAGEQLKVTFEVPSGAAITAVPSGTGWSCSPSGSYPRTSGQIDCVRTAALAVGDSAPTITVPAVSNVNGDVIFLSSAKAFKANGTDEVPDGDLSNNEKTVTVSSSLGSDVSIVKTQSPSNGSVAIGGEMTYTLTPRWNGGVAPGSTGNNTITVTDTLGAGLTYTSASGDGWSCTPAGSVITCERPGPFSGTPFSNMPIITVKAAASIVDGTTLSNTAVIAAPEPDPTPSNNTSSVTATTTNKTDLEMYKTTSLSVPVMVGTAFEYNLRVRNRGPLSVPVGDTITVTDTLPATITLNSIGAVSGWTCSANNPLPAAGATVTCTSTQGLNINGYTPAIPLNVVANAEGTISNQACLALTSTSVEENTPANNCNSAGVIATQTGNHADISITKTADKTTVQAGQPLTYTLTVSNAGPAVPATTLVKDTLSNLIGTAGLQSISFNNANTTCSPTGSFPKDVGSSNVECTIASLAVGATETITITVLPNNANAVDLSRVNTAIAYSTDIADDDPTNNTANVTTNVTPVVDLRVKKQAAPDPVNAGGPLTYTLTVINDGPSTATDVVIEDLLPAKASFISVDTGTCATAPAAGDLGGPLICQIPSLAKGQSVLKYRIRPTIDAVGEDLVNTVKVSTATTESNTNNNTDSTTTPVIAPELDILVNKNDTPDPVDLGELVTYTIRIDNTGPSAGSNLSMVDVFPVNSDANAAPTAVFSYQGGLTVSHDGVCVEPAIGATAGTLTCDWNEATNKTFDAGARTVTYQMKSEVILNSNPTGTAFNKVTVKVDEEETQTTNNQVTEPTTTRRKTIATDLAGTKTASPKALVPGTEVVFTLGVENLGPEVSKGAQIIDPLPVGLTFVSASAGCFEAAGTVSCAVGDLAVGDSVSFAITARVNDDFTGANLENQAFIKAPGDTDPSNNDPKSENPVIHKSVGVPTLSEWALILLAMLMAAGAYVMNKRNGTLVR